MKSSPGASARITENDICVAGSCWLQPGIKRGRTRHGKAENIKADLDGRSVNDVFIMPIISNGNIGSPWIVLNVARAGADGVAVQGLFCKCHCIDLSHALMVHYLKKVTILLT